jgi:hypothetical protein
MMAGSKYSDPKYSGPKYSDPMHSGMYQGVMNDFKLRWFDDSAPSRKQDCPEARLPEARLPPADRQFSIEIRQRQRP